MTKPWTTTELKTAGRLWREGKSMQEIADALDRTRFSVKQKAAVDRTTFPMRKRRKGTAEKLVKIRFEVSPYLYARVRAAARKENVSMTQHMHTVLAKHYMRSENA